MKAEVVITDPRPLDHRHHLRHLHLRAKVDKALLIEEGGYLLLAIFKTNLIEYQREGRYSKIHYLNVILD